MDPIKSSLSSMVGKLTPSDPPLSQSTPSQSTSSGQTGSSNVNNSRQNSENRSPNQSADTSTQQNDKKLSGETENLVCTPTRNPQTPKVGTPKSMTPRMTHQARDVIRIGTRNNNQSLVRSILQESRTTSMTDPYHTAPIYSLRTCIQTPFLVNQRGFIFWSHFSSAVMRIISAVAVFIFNLYCAISLRRMLQNCVLHLTMLHYAVLQNYVTFISQFQ